MKNRNLFLKTFLQIVLLLFPLLYLISCSKEGQNNNGSQVIQISLTDTSYHDLLHDGGSFVIPKYNIIVGFNNLAYYCADSQCPICGRTILFAFNSGFTWRCEHCFISGGDGSGIWHDDGTTPPVPGLKALKAYTVDRSGNLLYIHLHL